MHKLLLFYPSFSGGEDTDPLYTDIPLSVVALAQDLHGSSQDKYKIQIVDQRLGQPEPYNDLLKDVFAVGISATTSMQIIHGIQFANAVRRYDPDIPIIWGGWHASLMPKETILSEWVDIVLVGQGERVLGQLAERILQQKSLDDIPNLLYKDKYGAVIETKQQSLSDFIMPSTMVDGYGYVSIKSYIHKGWGNQRILGYEASRGCPNACSFCSISSIYRSKWRGMRPAEILHDLQYLQEQYSIDAVHFFDNNFFADKRRALEMAEHMVRRQMKIHWDGTIYTEQFLSMSEKEIEVLKAGGFYRIITGVESGDEEVLSHLNKRSTNSQVLEMVHRCKQYEIMPTLSFMVGFPWAPEKDTINTLRLIEQIKQSNEGAEILLFIFSPYLGTPLYKTAQSYGMKFPEDLQGWSAFTYDRSNTPWMSASLKRKIDRYLRLLGTKTLKEGQKDFYKGFNDALS